MARLDHDRQKKLEPQRMNIAVGQIQKLGFEPTILDSTKLSFEYKGNKITYFPYSGWHTGKGITDGRGLKRLLNQIKK